MHGEKGGGEGQEVCKLSFLIIPTSDSTHSAYFPFSFIPSLPRSFSTKWRRESTSQKKQGEEEKKRKEKKKKKRGKTKSKSQAR